MKKPGQLEHLADLATLSVTLIAVILAGDMALNRFGTAASTSAMAREDRPVEDWDALRSQGRRVGPDDASVEIVQFGDYECPYCRVAERNLRAVVDAYPDQVAVIYRHLPLPQHPNAYRAAVLAECAAEEGVFLEVHRLLYEAITLIDLKPEAVADAVGIADATRFLQCASRTERSPRIEADMDAAKRIGVPGTPAIIVEGLLLGTPPDSVALLRIVRNHLAGG